MTDLDTDYIRDCHSDNQDVVPDNYYCNLEQAIGIAADYSSLNEIVLIWSVHEQRPRSRNCIDLEIDCDLVDNLDCNYSVRDYGSNYCLDFLENEENSALGPVGPLAA